MRICTEQNTRSLQQTDRTDTHTHKYTFVKVGKQSLVFLDVRYQCVRRSKADGSQGFEKDQFRQVYESTMDQKQTFGYTCSRAVFFFFLKIQ